MRPIPAGSFRRGSDESPDEQPAVDVELTAYEIDEIPVTNAAFAEFIADGGYRSATLWTPAGWDLVNQHRLEQPN